MNIRLKKYTVSLVRPFWICSCPEELMPGPYLVESDEELLEGASFVAYRPLFTTIRPLGPSGEIHEGRIYSVSSLELALLMAQAEGSRGQMAALKGQTTKSRALELLAHDEADNEGMRLRV